MKKLIAFVFFSCFAFLSVAQVLNTKFPLGSYSGRLKDSSFAENSLISCHIIDEQYVFISVLFDIDFGFGGNEMSAPLEFITKYTLKNDTLFFEQHDDAVPYILYFTSDDAVAPDDGNIQLQVQNTSMFVTYGISIHSSKGSYPILDFYEEGNYDQAVVDGTILAKAGDTLLVSTSMGEFGFPIPANVNKLYLMPNIPNLGFEYAFKGESVNELLLKTGITMDESTVFYLGPVSDTGLMKAKEKQSFTANKTIIQACKSIDRTENVSVYDNGNEGSYADENNQARKDTIRYSFSYKEALKIAKEENLFIRVFYMQGNQCVNEYLEQISTLNEEYYYYDDESSLLTSFVLVFLNEKDDKLVQRWGITKPGTDFILSPDEILLFQKKATCKSEYDKAFFSSKEKYLSEELQFIYLDQVIVPQLTKNPDNVKALKNYLDIINKMIRTIDYFSYNDPWATYISNRSYYFEHIKAEKIPSAQTIIKYLDHYAKAKMEAPFDTTLAGMIMTFYNIIYGSEVSASLSSYPVRYLIKHAGSLERLHINENYKCRTLYEIVYKNLANLKSGNQNKYTQAEILRIYEDAIKDFPEYEDYFYLLCYYALDLSAVSPDFYTDLLAFYKGYLQKLQSVTDWENYMQTLNEQITLYESNYGNIRVQNAEKLYKILPHLAWIIGLQEGKEGENITLALQCAKIAGQHAVGYYDSRYITPNYAALLYLLGRKDEAIALQKAYCADRADSYSDYDQEMMYRLKAMILDIYKPMIISD